MTRAADQRMEIEAKFKVSDHGPVRERLRQVGAQCLGRVLEVNCIFDDEQRSLLAGQRGLRVRVCHDEGGRRVSATLTYKGPPLVGQAKQRVEIETQVGDPEAVVELLRALGYVEVISFHKRRESWVLEEARVELDELPKLGPYIEIEAEDLSQIQRAQDVIGMTDLCPIAQTYVALVAEHSQRSGSATAQLWF